ncbi:hypothetical protein RI054_03g15340 [Pseudoscourfieldia marina]
MRCVVIIIVGICAPKFTCAQTQNAKQAPATNKFVPPPTNTLDLFAWDGETNEWDAVLCTSGLGPCVTSDLYAGRRKHFAVYIERAAKLTVHITNIDHQKQFEVFVRSNVPPTTTEHDFKIIRREPGFTQWSCVGSLLYFSVAIAGANPKKTGGSNAKFGVVVTTDGCMSKDYTKQCPGGWKPDAKGWCAAPKWYQGPCRKNNFFGQLPSSAGPHVSQPNTAVYKILWSERCLADWPCSELVSRRCMPDLSYVDDDRWRTATCSDGVTCVELLVGAKHASRSWRLVQVVVPPASAIGAEFASTDDDDPGGILRGAGMTSRTRLVVAVKQRLGPSDPVAASSAMESADGVLDPRALEKGFAWDQTFRGSAPFVELVNPSCRAWQRFLIGVYNDDDDDNDVDVGVTLFRVANRLVTAATCELGHIQNVPYSLGTRTARSDRTEGLNR